MDPRGQDARTVGHHQVARAEQVRQIADVLMADLAGLAAHDQQPRRVARLDRRLRDQLIGQLVVKVRKAHRARSSADKPLFDPSRSRPNFF